MAEILADDFSSDDRRRVVNAGVRHGRDAEIANMRAIADLGAHECDVDRHCDPRGAPCPRRAPLLGPRSRTRVGPHRGARHRRDQRRRTDRGASSHSTSTTSTPPSRNSTPATSPAKRPPTRTRGRSSRGLTPQSTGTNPPGRHRIGSTSTTDRVVPIEAGDLTAYLRAIWDLDSRPQPSTSRLCIG